MDWIEAGIKTGKIAKNEKAQKNKGRLMKGP